MPPCRLRAADTDSFSPYDADTPYYVRRRFADFALIADFVYALLMPLPLSRLLIALLPCFR